MQSTDNNKKNQKRSRSSPSDMPVTDTSIASTLDDSTLFPVEEIVQYPLPGFLAPTSLSFSPDDSLISYLFSPDHTLNRKAFAFDLNSCEPELFFSPPDGGLDESNISAEEKLRRERLRERGLGVTRYEWVKTSSKKKTIMVPLPAGIYFQDLSCPKPDLKLPSTPSSPIIDPRLSPNGSMLAYVRDYELHIMNLLNNETKQVTFGDSGLHDDHRSSNRRILRKVFWKKDCPCIELGRGIHAKILHDLTKRGPERELEPGLEAKPDRIEIKASKDEESPRCFLKFPFNTYEEFSRSYREDGDSLGFNAAPVASSNKSSCLGRVIVAFGRIRRC